MASIQFDKHEVECLERQIREKYAGIPWQLNQERSQVSPRDFNTILSFHAQVSSDFRVEAQSDGGTPLNLYGFQLYGEAVPKALAVLNTVFG